jgi:exopolysaccharide biosynthesis polyprenyl glycosylphosphotransferase
MDNQRQFAHRRLMVLMDAVIIVLSMVLAAVLHTELRDYFGVFKEPSPTREFLLLAYMTLPMMLAIGAILGLHRQLEQRFQLQTLLWGLLRLHAYSLLGIALLTLLAQYSLNRSLIGLFLLLTFVLMLTSRLALHGWRQREHAYGVGRGHLLLIGNDETLVQRVLAAARDEPMAPQIVGVLVSNEARREGLERSGVPVIGTISDLPRVLHDHTIDDVVLATHGLTPGQFADVVAACDQLGTPMRQLVLPEFHDGRRLGLDRQFGLPFVTLSKVEWSTEALALKRAVDVLGSGVALLLLSPLLLLIALAIFATMGRPIFYSQERIGFRGRRFRMLKFRSMIPNAEGLREDLSQHNEMDGPVFKITRDPRITPLGRVLRRFSLDELPQLLNVFVGSMSLVGPRPLPVAEQQQISGAMRRRLSMRPGITGLWQVSGRNDVQFDQWMQKDLEYLDNWSNLLDLKLLLLTIPAVLIGRGAR